MKNLSGSANYLPKVKEAKTEESIENFDPKELEDFIKNFNDLSEKAEKLYLNKTTKEMYDVAIRLHSLKNDIELLKKFLN